MTHNFRKLQVWHLSKALVKDIYIITQKFPKEETFGLTSQIRRCAVSIPSNIAEGCGRDTNPNLINFLNIAQGSACELETQLEIALDLNYINELSAKELLKKLEDVQKMIRKFRDYINNIKVK